MSWRSDPQLDSELASLDLSALLANRQPPQRLPNNADASSSSSFPPRPAPPPSSPARTLPSAVSPAPVALRHAAAPAAAAASPPFFSHSNPLAGAGAPFPPQSAYPQQQRRQQQQQQQASSPFAALQPSVYAALNAPRPPSAAAAASASHPLSRSEFFTLRQQQAQRKRERETKRKAASGKRRAALTAGAASPSSSRRSRASSCVGEAAFLDKQLTVYVQKQLEVAEEERPQLQWERWAPLQTLLDRTADVGHSGYTQLMVACMQRLQDAKAERDGSASTRYVGAVRAARTQTSGRGGRAGAVDWVELSGDADDRDDTAPLQQPDKRRRLLCKEGACERGEAIAEDSRFSADDSKRGKEERKNSDGRNGPSLASVMDADADEDEPIFLLPSFAAAGRAGPSSPLHPPALPPRPLSPLLDFPPDDAAASSQLADSEADPLMRLLLRFFLSADATEDVILIEPASLPVSEPQRRPAPLNAAAAAAFSPHRLPAASDAPQVLAPAAASSNALLPSAPAAAEGSLAVPRCPPTASLASNAVNSCVAGARVPLPPAASSPPPPRPPPLPCPPPRPALQPVTLSPLSSDAAPAALLGKLSVAERKAIAEAKQRAWRERQQQQQVRQQADANPKSALQPLTAVCSASAEVIDLTASEQQAADADVDCDAEASAGWLKKENLALQRMRLFYPSQ